jgi:hypothetical protein
MGSTLEGYERYEERFGPPVERRYGPGKDSEAKRERHFYRTVSPGSSPVAQVPIHDRTPSDGPHPAALERGAEQIIEITHELAEGMHDASQPTLL